eukprot:1155590-Pelagomonas_calceolata.AAC.2
MDVPLFWKELTRVMDLESRCNGCGWRWVLPAPCPPPRPPLLLTGQQHSVMAFEILEIHVG